MILKENQVMTVAKRSCEVGMPSGQITMEESASTGFQECKLNSNKVTVTVL